MGIFNAAPMLRDRIEIAPIDATDQERQIRTTTRLTFLLSLSCIQTDTGYDPRKSKVTEDRMSEWRELEITGDVTEVPGIGPAAAELLAKEDYGEEHVVQNTWQLFAKYLSLKTTDQDGKHLSVKDHNDKFWYWLKYKGIKSHRSAIVKVSVTVRPVGRIGVVEYNDSLHLTLL